MMRCLLLVLMLAAAPALAQVVGDCAPGRAERDLDINDVKARVFNNGSLFFGNTTVDGSGYLVPKGTGRSPIFAASLWVSGLVNGEPRSVGTTYADFEFWPGPLDADGNPPADCAAYDRIYRVSRGDVARYLRTGEATDDLRDWPAHLGAPVLDGDGVAGNYNLAGGDEPAISGEQMAWWVMNDAGNAQTNTSGPPLGLEVRVEAFALSSLSPALNRSTLYRYRLTYRGETTLDSAYVGIFADTDLGDPGDDYIGSDTTLNLGFTYNADDEDDGGLGGGYGARPPALGIQVLRGPVGLANGRDDDRDGRVDESGERVGMASFLWFFNEPFSEAPCFFLSAGDQQMFNMVRGRLCRGELVTEGGYGGSGEGPVTTFYFPGDPVAGAFWSEENIDGQGTRTDQGDRRLTLSVGPFRLEPGETEEVVFAIPFAQGTDRLDSVVKLREAAAYIQRAYDLGLFEPERVGTATEPTPPAAVALSRPSPNPFGATTSFTLTVPPDAGTVSVAVYDVLGREVAVLAEGVLAPGDHPLRLDGTRLAAGVYFVRLQTQRQTESLKLVRIE